MQRYKKTIGMFDKTMPIATAKFVISLLFNTLKKQLKISLNSNAKNRIKLTMVAINMNIAPIKVNIIEYGL